MLDPYSPQSMGQEWHESNPVMPTAPEPPPAQPRPEKKPQAYNMMARFVCCCPSERRYYQEVFTARDMLEESNREITTALVERFQRETAHSTPVAIYVLKFALRHMQQTKNWFDRAPVEELLAMSPITQGRRR
jgi:hypothetical protein